MSLQKRECGECNACCFLFVVHDESFNEISDASDWCKHCEKGVGCKIYESRPPACRNYSCVWKSGAFGENHRPDKWGVVMDFENIPDTDVRLIFFRELHEGKLDSEALVSMMDKMVVDPKNFIIACYLDGRKKPIKPNDMSEDAAITLLKDFFASQKRLAEEHGIHLK